MTLINLVMQNYPFRRPSLKFEENQDFSEDFVSSLLNKEVEISGILTPVQSTWVKVIKVDKISSL